MVLYPTNLRIPIYRIAILVLYLALALLGGPRAVHAGAPPVFTNQPAGGSFLIGEDVTLSAGVISTTPVAYRWMFNGTNIPNNLVSSVAGGSGGDGGPAIACSIMPHDVVADALGNVYVVDSLYNVSKPVSHHRIRKITPDGKISTFAGGAKQGFSGDGGLATDASLSYPYCLAIDLKGNVYFTDSGNVRVRRIGINGIISTVAGNGIAGFSGDGGPATQASLGNPEGIDVDQNGNLYIADYDNHRIRKVGTDGIISTIAGDGAKRFFGDGGAATNASLYYPKSVAADPNGNVYVADAINLRIRKIDSSGIISTFAGSGIWGNSGNGGPATNAAMKPCRIGMDSAGNLLVGEAGNFEVRRISKLGIIDVVPFPGFPSPPEGVHADGSGNVFVAVPGADLVWKCDTNGVTSKVASNGYTTNYDDGLPANLSELNGVNGLVFDKQDRLIFSETNTHRVRMIGTDGIVTTIAGTGIAGYSGDGGAATNAQLNAPIGMALDGDSNLYIADSGNHVIRMISKSGVISTIVGNGKTGPPGNGGLATNASLVRPVGVAIDGDGNIIIGDAGDRHVRIVSPYGIITDPTIPPYISGYNWGLISGIIVDSRGYVFVASNFNEVNELRPDGLVIKVAGNGGYGFSGDEGLAKSATLLNPTSVCFDLFGNILVADSGNGRIRMVSKDAFIHTILGPTGGGVKPGPTNTYLSSMVAIAINSEGKLFIADSVDNRIWSVPLTGSHSYTIKDLSSRTSGSYQVIASNIFGSATSQVAVVDIAMPSLGISATTDGRLSLMAAAPPDSALVLESALNLGAPVVWQPVFTNSTDINSEWSYYVPETNTISGVYYRLSTPQ